MTSKKIQGGKTYIGEKRMLPPIKNIKNRELSESKNKKIKSSSVFLIEHLIRLVKIFSKLLLKDSVCVLKLTSRSQTN